ncbi:TonB-dependent receptor [Novosphingobium aquae]|uniref:TonB-dependent receptor n=1 Tax=Novosphingobium aquae TaxID=3133435 RepID=A0ABU8S688_9SPHN
MKITTRIVLLGTASVALMAMPSVAFAQSAPADEEAQAAPPAEESVGTGNEIVVTATKREQTLQDVPVAVSVTTGETIERAQIRDIRDLSSVVPSLRVNQLQSSANTNFYIRGFGNGANNAGIEPSVGLFVDGVYRSRSASMIGDLPDVQRVEVLRGPQSTLFGKNASAGVISMTTRKPRFEFGGNVEATYGNFNAFILKGVVTGPISDTIAASIAGGYNRRDGYVKDGATGSDINERNRWFVRGQLLFEPSNDLSVRIIGDYGKIDEVCCSVMNLRRSAASSVILALGGKLSDPAKPFADITYNNVDSTNKIENWGLSGQIDYSMGFLKLTSITAFRRTGAITNQDSDFSSADLLGRNFQDLKVDTFTQELRLNTDWDGPVNVMLGGFYFNEKVDQANEIFWGTQARPYADQLIRGATGNALNVALLEGTFGALEGQPTKYTNRFFAAGTGLNEAYKLKDEAYSIFGQVDFEITDGLTLTGGANYTHDSKVFSTNTVSNDAFSGVDFNAAAYAPFRYQLLLGGLLGQGVPLATAQAQAAALQNVPSFNPLNGLKPLQFLPPFLNVPNALESGKLSDGHWNWTARLAYEFNDNLNAYVSYATGYKAASINLSRDSRPTPADLATINSNSTYSALRLANLSSGSRFAGPEESTVYEFGLKGSWGVASANFAIFKQSIEGFQSNIFTGTGFFLANAGKQSVFGLEFEGMVKPTSELTLNLAMTYLDAKYDSFALSAFGDLSGTRPGGVSPLSMTIGAEWNKELGNGDRVILRGDYHYEALFKLVEGLPGLVVKNSAGAIIDTGPALAAGRDFKQDVNQVNASLTYAMQNGIELSIWGRNLTDNRSILQIFDSPAQSGSISGYVSEPRTFGGSVRFKF